MIIAVIFLISILILSAYSIGQVNSLSSAGKGFSSAGKGFSGSKGFSGGGGKGFGGPGGGSLGGGFKSSSINLGKGLGMMKSDIGKNNLIKTGKMTPNQLKTFNNMGLKYGTPAQNFKSNAIVSGAYANHYSMSNTWLDTYMIWWLLSYSNMPQIHGGSSQGFISNQTGLR